MNLKPGTLVRVMSPTGRRVTLAYVSRAPKEMNGQMVVKLDGRAGWIPLTRIHPI